MEKIYAIKSSVYCYLIITLVHCRTVLCYRFGDKDVPAGVFTGTGGERNSSKQEGEIAAHWEGPGGKQCAKKYSWIL
jgi:hypothetical protein